VSDQDQKTHKPTPRRLAEFRKRGEIARSPELATSASLLVGLLCMVAFAGTSATALAEFMRAAGTALDTPDRSPDVRSAGLAFVAAVAPVGVGAMLGYLVASVVQLGWPPTFKKPGFDLKRLFSLQAVGQSMSPKAAAGRVFKAVIRTAAVVGVVAIALSAEIDRYMAAPAFEAIGLGRQIAAGAARLAVGAAAALTALAVVDFFWARRKMMKKMMMAPEEVKRDMREQEGDPQMRAFRKRRMRELSRRRSADVATADVVLVNPTEYAVALRYSADKDRAPRVVAKGRRMIAEHIRTVARQAGIAILERPPLTRLIYKLVPEGREIPAQLYHAVAEVLAYVYRLRERRR
jgi:flagellar biosynthetic protein FlhB